MPAKSYPCNLFAFGASSGARRPFAALRARHGIDILGHVVSIPHLTTFARPRVMGQKA